MKQLSLLVLLFLMLHSYAYAIHPKNLKATLQDSQPGHIKLECPVVFPLKYVREACYTAHKSAFTFHNVKERLELTNTGKLFLLGIAAAFIKRRIP